MALKLISVNVEGSRHLERVLPFLTQEHPEVLCVQELMATDIPRFTKAVGVTTYHFMPMRYIDGIECGVGLFSQYPFSVHEEYYHGGRDRIVEYDKDDQEGTECFGVVCADVAAPDGTYRIATTHFIWTPNGLADDFQREGIAKLLPLLQEQKELVLCGDFNAPRGGEIYGELAKHYTDSVPLHYQTSIDVQLHRNGAARPHELADKMVDHLWTTPSYSASNVSLVSGVSDHMALVATIAKS